MGSKDKGGRGTKKVAAKGLKEKRLAKKAKKASHDRSSNESVNRTLHH